MFDWEGEELANIIWGEAGENKDHIVPYPDESYEKSPRPYGEHNKVSDHKAADVKFAEKTPDGSNTRYDTHGMVSRYGIGSTPVLSSSDATKLDLQHTDEKAQVDNGSQSFDTRPEDRDIDYGWANVGSFDDLDGILSINEYENADIFSIGSPSLRLGDLRSDCEHVETKSGFIKDVNTNFEKMECSGGKTEKVWSYKFSVMFCFGSNPEHVHCLYAHELHMGSYHRFIGFHSQLLQILQEEPHPLFIRLVLSMFQCQVTPESELERCAQKVKNVIPGFLLAIKEKIEKLRRRQQMRALLAIRKQQQEFRHQPSCNDYSNESQNDGSLSTLMSLEKSDLDTRHMMMNRSSLEDTILYQLENVISTLGIQIRLCIRDSLFRLAQSALQRQYAGDTVSDNEANDVTKERLGCTKSSARTPVGETKTNPIDRAVAHLLFHRPAGLSGEFLQSLESPSSGSRAETEGSSRGMALH